MEKRCDLTRRGCKATVMFRMRALTVDDEPVARKVLREELHRIGIQTELLTGDSARSAGEIAERIGVKDISSGLLPEQKSARVDELIRSGRTVAMIGDGLNDAPALSHAYVGVAMGSGTEVAHASANVLLIGNDLRKFVETVKTARWCRSVFFKISTERLSWMR
jgi:P-type E1-E2 ATPase